MAALAATRGAAHRGVAAENRGAINASSGS